MADEKLAEPADPRTEPLDLEPIKARERAATKGPWTNGVRGAGPSGDAHMCRIVARGVIDNPNIAGAAIGATWHPEYCISYVGFSRQQNIDNAEFMAHAREDIPQLVAEIERLRAAPAPTTQPDAPRTEPLMKPLDLVDDRPEADEAAERIIAAPVMGADALLVARAYLALRAAPAPATGDLVQAAWRSAALLKDRTRREIRDLHKAGDSIESLAVDFGVPVEFIDKLCAWQMGSHAPAPATGDLVARLRRAADDPLELSYMTGTVRALLREAADTLEQK